MTDTLIDPASATAPTAGAAVVVEADGRTAQQRRPAHRDRRSRAARRALRVLTTWGARHREMYDETAVAERDRLSAAQLERRLNRALKRSPDLDAQSIDGYDRRRGIPGGTSGVGSGARARCGPAGCGRAADRGGALRLRGAHLRSAPPVVRLGDDQGFSGR